jgi:hypothetical protein
VHEINIILHGLLVWKVNIPGNGVAHDLAKFGHSVWSWGLGCVGKIGPGLRVGHGFGRCSLNFSYIFLLFADALLKNLLWSR